MKFSFFKIFLPLIIVFLFGLNLNFLRAAQDSASVNLEVVNPCGNFILDPGEECDNTSTTTGSSLNNGSDESCNDDCELTYCGDNNTQSVFNGRDRFAEECDDGVNNNQFGICTTNCTKTYCGDNDKQDPNWDGISEQCDLGTGNNGPNKTCNNSCQLTTCGDGIVQDPNGVGLNPGDPGFTEKCEASITPSQACTKDGKTGTQQCTNCAWGECVVPSDPDPEDPPSGGNSSFIFNSNVSNNQNNDQNNTSETSTNTPEDFLEIYNIEARAQTKEAEINWTVSVQTTCQLKWGRTSELMNEIVSISSNESRRYTSNITDLLPNTIYYFQISCIDTEREPQDFSHSFIHNFRTEKLIGKETFEENVSGFSANYDAKNDAVKLTWQNPQDSRFLAAKILKSHTAYPKHHTDGQVIYNDKIDNFLDSNILPGVRYYYTIFAYDNDGNLSSGALAEIVIPFPENQKSEDQVDDGQDVDGEEQGEDAREQVNEIIEVKSLDEDIQIKIITSENNVAAIELSPEAFESDISKIEIINIIIDSVPKAISEIKEQINQVKKVSDQINIVGEHIYEYKAFVNDKEIENFAKEVTVSITYTIDQVAKFREDTLAIHYYDEDQKKWISLPSTIDKANRLVETKVDHFTLFALLGEIAEVDEKIKEKPLKKITDTLLSQDLESQRDKDDNQKIEEKDNEDNEEDIKFTEEEEDIKFTCQAKRDFEVSFFDFQFWTRDRTINLNREDQEINLLPESQLDIEFDHESLSSFETLILEIKPSVEGAGKYLFQKKKRDSEEYYQTSISVPKLAGKYSLNFSFQDKDGCELQVDKDHLNGFLNIKKFGKIKYRKNAIEMAEITLFERLENGTAERWNGDNFFQNNPKISINGEYGFLVASSAQAFFIRVNKEGFSQYVSEDFFVSKNVVNQTIELKKEFSWMAFGLISIISVFALILFHLFLKRKRFRDDHDLDL